MNISNISKSESYNLSPDQYLQKFIKPYSVISHKGKQDKYEIQINMLEQLLVNYNDNNVSAEIKKKAITDLNSVVEKWMINVFSTYFVPKNNEQRELINLQYLYQLGYGLKIFGSYSLNTSSYDGDIDMICVVPDFFIREEHFYGQLTEQIKKLPSSKQVFAIPDAIVPLIRMTIYDVQIDLLVSRIPINFLKDNPKFFQGQLQQKAHKTEYSYVNQKQLKSINGYRTSIYLKKNIKHYKNYQVVLKAIKMWAKNKGIYSQIHGYLGGAAFSIMLAKIVQLYPNYSPLQLLDRFFFIYANWIWTMPITLQYCQIQEKTEGGMLIFTPLQPHLNTAHYVSKITCHIVRKYLRIGSKVIQDINKKKKQWKDLFKPIDFFYSYDNFIQLSIMGQQVQQLVVWKGHIESKLRKFTRYLQNQIQNLQLVEIHPYPHSFISKHSQYKHCFKYYFGIKCYSNPNLSDYCQIDITDSVRQFLDLLQTCNGIQKVPKSLNVGFAHLQKNSIDTEVINGVNIYN